jgi:hypothetical protein
MNHYFFGFILLLVSFKSFTQNSKNQTFDEDSIIFYPDVEPSFPGGELELNKYIIHNLKSLSECSSEDVGGTSFRLNFVIEKDGSVSNIDVIQKTEGCSQLINELKRILSTMPKWIPGEIEGIKKRVQVTIPLNLEFNRDR